MRFDERDNKKRKYWISKWKNTHSIRELIFLVLIISPTLELLNQCECGRSWWWRQYHQCVGDVSHTKKGANCKAQIWQLLDVFYYLVSLDFFLVEYTWRSMDSSVSQFSITFDQWSFFGTKLRRLKSRKIISWFCFHSVCTDNCTFNISFGKR